MTISSCRILAAAFAFLIIGSLPMAAQQALGSSERGKVFSEMRAYKHDVLTKSLNLTKEQQREFFPIYDELDDALMQINNETRDLERSVAANENASATEIEAAALAVYSQKEREGKVEMEYFDKFKEILTPRQLLGLRSAEKRFTQKLVRQHRRLTDRNAD